MTGSWDNAAGAADGHMNGDQVRAVTFQRSAIGKRGYDMADVDAFLDRAAEALDGRGTLGAPEVRNVRFGKPRIGKRGYDELSVDSFLDELEQECARRGW